jgi:hypothetical protein
LVGHFLGAIMATLLPPVAFSTVIATVLYVGLLRPAIFRAAEAGSSLAQTILGW